MFLACRISQLHESGICQIEIGSFPKTGIQIHELNWFSIYFEKCL